MDALIVTPSKKAQGEIASVVSSCGEYAQTFAESIQSALSELKRRSFDLVIINGDMTGGAREAALTAARKEKGGVILLESAARYEETVLQMTANGIIAVPKPISRLSLFAAVQTVHAANMRLEELREENKDLSKKIEDLKIIDRAKIALIQRLGYTEDEAHKYIEKQAMNLRTSKREIAMSVLRTYEN